MVKSVSKSSVSPRNITQRVPALFDGYCGRRWGYGAAANRAAANRFGVVPRTIGRWRAGETALPAAVLVQIMVFEGVDAALDHIDPDFRG